MLRCCEMFWPSLVVSFHRPRTQCVHWSGSPSGDRSSTLLLSVAAIAATAGSGKSTVAVSDSKKQSCILTSKSPDELRVSTLVVLSKTSRTKNEVLEHSWTRTHWAWMAVDVSLRRFVDLCWAVQGNTCVSVGCGLRTLSACWGSKVQNAIFTPVSRTVDFGIKLADHVHDVTLSKFPLQGWSFMTHTRKTGFFRCWYVQ